MDIKEKIGALPNSPGVYIMKDEKETILYVGKANNLKKRVSSYFYHGRHLASRLEALVQRIKDIAYIPTTTAAEALIYENGLIKRLAPKYNVALRDDKSYPMLKLTVNEKFPRLFVTRRRRGDGALYYGPYSNAKLLREAVGILRWLFPLRTCNKIPKTVCLNYHIKQCPGPCAGKIDEGDYRNTVNALELFLEGKRAELLKFLGQKMQEASKREDFEEASKLKARIEALSAIKDSSVRYSPSQDLEELGMILGIAGNIDVIEAFDVSNIMGEEAVGSMIYFYKGKSRKSEYRRFKIKTVSRIDDYAMMRELVRRRYSRLLKEKRDLPNLVVIDGGKGHLAVAVDELKKLSISGVPIIGIAKEFEHIYVEVKKDPIVLPRESKALHLLERIRDEAHRFAIAYHKRLLSKRIKASELNNIRGIGPKRRKALLNHFGSIDRVKIAEMGELLKVEGMDEKSARSVIAYFEK